MTHRSTEAALPASTVAGQPALARLRARAQAISARGVLTTAQHTLTVFGISALALIALLMFRFNFALVAMVAVGGLIAANYTTIAGFFGI